MRVMAEKVRWTDDEMDKLVSLMAPMRLSDPVPPLVTILKRAMQQLPADRRRPIRTITGLDGLVQKLELAMDEYKRLSQRAMEPPPKVPTSEEILTQMSTEELMCFTIKRVFREVTVGHTNLSEQQQGFTSLAYRLLGAGAPANNGHANGPHQQKKKVRVCVVGLLNDQQRHVEKAVGAKLDLRFVSKEQRKPSFPDCDKVVLCCDFIDHGWESAAVNKFGTDLVVRHKGGITGLVAILEGF